MPSSGAQTMGRNGHGVVTRLMPGVTELTIGCNYSEYSFCFYVAKGNPGPYVETSAGTLLGHRTLQQRVYHQQQDR